MEGGHAADSWAVEFAVVALSCIAPGVARVKVISSIFLSWINFAFLDFFFSDSMSFIYL
jgi:hypothetical protein